MITLPGADQRPGSRRDRLRPGRSPWRTFHRPRPDGVPVVAAIGPEANHDPRGSRRAIILAEQRLAGLEPE